MITRRLLRVLKQWFESVDSCTGILAGLWVDETPELGLVRRVTRKVPGWGGAVSWGPRYFVSSEIERFRVSLTPVDVRSHSGSSTRKTDYTFLFWTHRPCAPVNRRIYTVTIFFDSFPWCPRPLLRSSLVIHVPILPRAEVSFGKTRLEKANTTRVQGERVWIYSLLILKTKFTTPGNSRDIYVKWVSCK